MEQVLVLGECVCVCVGGAHLHSLPGSVLIARANRSGVSCGGGDGEWSFLFLTHAVQKSGSGPSCQC